MKETVHFTRRQKAIISVIARQFEKNRAKALLLYDPIDACSQLSETGELIELGLDIPGQFEVLRELSGMDLSIRIDILKNDLDPESKCVTDALHNGICIDDDSNELEQEMFDIRLAFGSAYIFGTVEGIKKIKAMCEEGYRAELKFIDESNYYVECYREGFRKTYTFASLHAGKRPQLIVKYAMDHKDDEDPVISKKILNEVVLKKSGAPLIGRKESIASSIFDEASMAVLSFFFDFKTKSVCFKGYIREDLTGADIAIFEKYCESHSV